MNRTLHYYNYEQCYAHYTKRIMNIRQAKIHGEVIVAKPVLLLALIDSVECGKFTDNQFALNDWLENRYLTLMKQYTQHSQFHNPTDISNPFWHLQSDGFWHLHHEATVADGSDDDLWVLLHNETWRKKLRDYIVEHKLTDDWWQGLMAAESLGILTALLLVA